MALRPPFRDTWLNRKAWLVRSNLHRPQQLLFLFRFLRLPGVPSFHDALDRTDAVLQIAVPFGTIHAADQRRLRYDELFFFQPVNVFHDGVPGHAQCRADGTVARPAFAALSILPIQKITVDRDQFSERNPPPAFSLRSAAVKFHAYVSRLY